MSCVAIIPARGGSKRLPRKNIREFHGKPVIAYAIATAKASVLFDDVFVSTEDEEIAGVALKFGASLLLRNPAMAEDSVGTQEVMADALQGLDRAIKLEPWAFKYTHVDYACCIYPVCPMLTAKDLYIGWSKLLEHGVPYIFVRGYYYLGRAANFRDRVPLTEWLSLYFPVERYVDVNTEADWLRMEELYTAVK